MSPEASLTSDQKTKMKKEKKRESTNQVESKVYMRTKLNKREKALFSFVPSCFVCLIFGRFNYCGLIIKYVLHLWFW